MRIAHIHWSLGTGGVETMLPDIVNEQAKEHNVTLFIVNDWVETFILKKINDNVKVVLIGRKEGSRNPWPIVKLNVMLLKFRPDIIHTHAYREINLVIYPFAKRVRTIHNTHNNSCEYHKFDALISISKAVWNFTKKQGFDSIIATNGISVNQIKNRSDSFRKDKRLHFIQVSRLNIEQKGQDILLIALSILKKKYKRSEFTMHFVGIGEDESTLTRMTTDLGLDDNVVFEGLKEQSWIYSNLCNFDLFIQPSRYEGFGLTVAEAIAAKVPVLVSNIEGPLEIIDNGRFGLFFINKDVEDCASKMNYFIENGKNNSQLEEAYQYIATNYNVAATANKYIEVYKNIL